MTQRCQNIIRTDSSSYDSYNTFIDARSSWIFQTASVLVCPAQRRHSRAPPDPPRPRNCATPAPHGSTRYYRRKIGRRSPTRREAWKGASEDGLARSPLWRGIIKTWKSQYQVRYSNKLSMNVLTHSRTAVRAAVHGGWVGGWGAVRAAGVVHTAEHGGCGWVGVWFCG